ncbi:hypothetical protein D3C76_436070 [compost metagenome]
MQGSQVKRIFRKIQHMLQRKHRLTKLRHMLSKRVLSEVNSWKRMLTKLLGG